MEVAVSSESRIGLGVRTVFLLLSCGAAFAQAPDPGAAPRQPRIDPAQRVPSAPGETFEVRPVIERPFAEDEGDRVNISDVEVVDSLDRRRGALQAGIDEAVREALGAQPPQGFTVVQLQREVANAIADVYVDAGYQLAQAYVPEQTIENGVVRIRVVVGDLQQVLVQGNSMVSSAAIRRGFRHLEGRPVTKRQMDAALLRVTDLPGIRGSFGVFSPGEGFGTTNLSLRIQDEQRIDVDTFTDNHGNRFTGEYRAYLGLGINNPTGLLDRLDLFALQTASPINATFGGATYTIPGRRLRDRYVLSYVRNDYLIEPDEVLGLDVDGVVDVVSGTYQRSLVRSPYLNANGAVSVSRKEADVGGDQPSLDSLTVVDLLLGYDRISRRIPGASAVELRLSFGVPDFLGATPTNGCNGSLEQAFDDAGNPIGAPICAARSTSRIIDGGTRVGGDFFKLSGRYQRFQRLGEHQNLIIRAEGQWTPDPLLSLEQFSIGGPDSVRAYPLTEELVDKGFFASLELVLDAPFFAEKPTRGGEPWGDVFKLSFFLDYGAGALNDPLQSDVLEGNASVDLLGAGIGLQFLLPRLTMRLDLSRPVDLFLDDAPDPSNNRDPQFYFRIRYSY